MDGHRLVLVLVVHPWYPWCHGHLGSRHGMVRGHLGSRHGLHRLVGHGMVGYHCTLWIHLRHIAASL
ncbi:MAG: hypothetical protein GY697_23680 [Desulfobacterales bacterium]|nr:hypothetical protein [Desulfobacterales bacterium]